MKRKTSITLICSLFLSFVFAIENDTIFINSLKNFANREFRTDIFNKNYINWSQDNSPYYYLFISYPDRISSPDGIGKFINLTYYDSKKQSSIINKYLCEGFSVFEYKTYGQAETDLSERLLSYSPESTSFIVFHELMHNYLLKNNINIPGEFKEAICDISGNYLTLEYAKNNHNTLNTESVTRMIELNERTYELMNYYILQIDEGFKDVCILCDQFSNAICKIKNEYDKYQTDRFYHPVNTAYFLKNRSYCEYYFLIKKVFLKARTFENFIKLIEDIPTESNYCKEYFQNYLTNGTNNY